jgi:hypothetical protein
MQSKIQVKILESEDYPTVNSALRELMSILDCNTDKKAIDVCEDLLLQYQTRIDKDNCVDTKLKYNVISRLLKE